MEKQKLLYQQARLHDRGAAEMVLQTISASKGRFHTESHPSQLLQHCCILQILRYSYISFFHLLHHHVQCLCLWMYMKAEGSKEAAF